MNPASNARSALPSSPAGASPVGHGSPGGVAIGQPPLLQVRNLQAWYGQAQVLFGLDLDVQPGEVVALVGRNGAGKSTTLQAIMGLLARASGSVTYDGQAILGWPPYRIARAGLGYVPEDRRVFGELTVLENLDTGRQPARPGQTTWTPERLFQLFPNLGTMPQRRGQHMSGGEQQMLTVARTLMGNPRLILLDEPSEGVAPILVEQMADMVRALRHEGIAVLLSEQNEGFVDTVADRRLRLEQGHLLAAAPSPSASPAAEAHHKPGAER